MQLSVPAPNQQSTYYATVSTVLRVFTASKFYTFYIKHSLQWYICDNKKAENISNQVTLNTPNKQF